MLAGFILSLIALMRLFPQTPLARLLHEQTVEQPLRWLQSCERHHLIFLLILLAMPFAGEALLAIGSQDLLMVFAWDMSLYVDTLVATWALAAAARGKSARLWLRTKLARPVKSRAARPRARRRAKPKRSSGKASNDDEEPAFAIAA